MPKSAMYIPVVYRFSAGALTNSTVAFPQDVHRVDILKLGRSLLIVPQGRRWDDLFLAGPRLTADFMTEREQPAAEMRDPV